MVAIVLCLFVVLCITVFRCDGLKLMLIRKCNDLSQPYSDPIVFTGEVVGQSLII